MKCFILYLFIATALFGATYNSDGSRADTQAKIDLAADGDKVTLPSGSFTWTGTVSIAGKGIQLEGAGAGRVVARSASSVAVGTGTKTFTLTTENVASIAALRAANITGGTTLKIYRTGGQFDAVLFPPWGITDNQVWMRGTVTSLVGDTLTMSISSNSTTTGTHGLWLVTTEESTTIVNDCPSYTFALDISEDATHSSEISGIRFTHSTSGSGEWRDIVGLRPTTGGKPVLIHDCFFLQTKNGAGIKSHTNKGVVWNCSFAAMPFAMNASAFSHIADDLATSWTTTSTMGTADATGTSNVYFEDCDFHAFLNGTDIADNARAVLRNMLMDNVSINSHGADTGTYGLRHFEVYDSEFIFNNLGNQTFPSNWMFFIRGGTGVITGNRIDNLASSTWGDKSEIVMIIINLQLNGGPNPNWGKDIPGVQYPCPRQVGMGYVTGLGGNDPGGVYKGDSEPLYIWGNTGTQAIAIADNISTPGPPGYDSAVDYIIAGRDYFADGTAKPGWTRYTYPHPLRSAETQAAAPSFNPVAGTYSTAQSVTITSSTSGASIRYTIDGSTPSSSSGTVYSTPVLLLSTATLKAIAYKSGLTDSTVTSGTYTIGEEGGDPPTATITVSGSTTIGTLNLP